MNALPLSPAVSARSDATTARVGYRGKHFTLPELGTDGFTIEPDASRNACRIPSAAHSPIIADLNTVWDRAHFLTPRLPVSLGVLAPDELARFAQPGMPRALDMPIKFPGTGFRVPAAFAQLREVIERVAHYEAAINPQIADYYGYLTVDQGPVKPGTLQREAPCHVDGFQGARWNPKVRINHTYVVGDVLPTTYYVQPFDLMHLDEARHNFFWEMNRIVAQDRAAHAWQPQPGELNLIDAYTVHRGTEATVPTYRTWIRLSFEVRVFDRLGNAHNPLFDYDWAMVPRDIEGLGLVAYDEACDPSLRVFPWQNLDGTAHTDPKARTKPRLTGPADPLVTLGEDQAD